MVKCVFCNNLTQVVVHKVQKCFLCFPGVLQILGIKGGKVARTVNLLNEVIM